MDRDDSNGSPDQQNGQLLPYVADHVGWRVGRKAGAAGPPIQAPDLVGEDDPLTVPEEGSATSNG